MTEAEENAMREIFKDGFVERELSWWNAPGAEIGIVRADGQGYGEVLYEKGFGYRDLEKGLPMTAGSVGGIASCSKAFTAAVLASLVDEGKLDWDVPVRKYIPEFSLMDPAAGSGCTVRDMLCHRTGIAGHDGMWPQPGLSRKDYLYRMRFLEPNQPFRSVSQYSNTVYNLAGCVAEEIAGEKFEDLVQERIFDPLGMKRSFLSLERARKEEDFACGYFTEDVGVPGALRKMPGWEMNDIANPAAGVNTCASDMLSWLTLHISRGMYQGKRLFSENVMDQMHEASVSMSAFPWRFPEVPGYGFYGLGWKTAIYRGMTMTYHCGEIEGYSSITVFLPACGTGMFVLLNRHAMMTPLLLELVYTAFDSILDFPETDWAERLHPFAHEFTGSCESWPLVLMPEKGREGTELSHKAQEYAGVFRNPAYGDLLVSYGKPGGEIGVPYMHSGREESDKDLYLHWKEWILPLYHFHYDTFRVVNLKEDTLFYTVPMTYVYDEITGEISGFFLKLERTVKPVFFERVK